MMKSDTDWLAEGVAQFCQGDEVYGVGSVQKLYAYGCLGMLFVCFVNGPMYRWLKDHRLRVVLAEGPANFVVHSSLGSILGLWRVDREAYRAAAKLAPLLRGEGVRIVQAHWLSQQLLAGHLRRHGFTSVWQINNNMDSRRLWGLGMKLNHWLARRGSDLLLPCSDYIAANWQGCRIPIRTIRNAAPSLYNSLKPLPDRPVRTVIAGRIESSKGIHIAVETVLAARMAGHDVTLDVFGGPLHANPYADGLRDRVNRAGHGDAVRFMGFVNDLRQRHQDYHLGFQCRVDPEPCSVWVCETLVDGLPLIASATGGTPELVEDGVTGVLFDPKQPDSATRHLLSLLERPERMDEMRRAAFDRGMRLFTVDRFVRESLDAYRWIESEEWQPDLGT